MKRIPLLIALVLTFSFGLALAQGGSVYVLTDGLKADPNNGGALGIGVSGDGTGPAVDITFNVYFNNGTGDWVGGTTNGVRIYGPANFTPCTKGWINILAGDWYGYNTLDDPPDFVIGPYGPVDLFKRFFDGGATVSLRSATGTGSDSVVMSTYINYTYGMPDGFDDGTFYVNTGVADDLALVGEQLCIDSCFWPPSGTWLWAPGGVADWGGPYCFDVFELEHQPPQMVNCPGAYTGSHCVGVSQQFELEFVPDQDGGPFVNHFNVVSGPAGTNPDFATTGLYGYSPSLADVDASPITVVIEACDDFPSCGANVCTYVMNFTNEAPIFQDEPYYAVVGMGNSKSVTVEATDACDDPIVYNLLGVTPAPAGGPTSYSLAGATLTFNTVAGLPPAGDGGVTYFFEIEASDFNRAGGLTDTTVVEIEVIAESGFLVIIEKTRATPQGLHEMVDVNFGGADVLLGFDILISYDASALTLTNVIPGDIYDDCLGNPDSTGWEYFEYRFGPFGNCGNGCPSGMVRVVGIAETNNGPNHPVITCPGDDLLFSMDFLISNDRTLECMYVPIRFFWMDCGDNSFAYLDAVTECFGDMTLQGISRDVYEFEAYYYDSLIDPLDQSIANENVGWPTYLGAQNECDDVSGDYMWCEEIQDSILKPGPQRVIDFVNGGVDIVCADSIDARGDINLNGQANEIADAVLFSNYFVHGLGVFVVNVAGQIAATDVNADGMVLSVADLVYLIRVVVGDALPYSKLNPVGATYIADNGFVSVDQPMGAAYIVVAGDVAPTLLAENMNMQYAFDGTNTRILVSSMEAGQTFEGQFIAVGGDVISIELATYEGAPVAAKLMPSEYALAQNYPNPFNPATTIAFDLKHAGDYSLTIYNVTGQTVAEFSGAAEAGSHSVIWDASMQASGIYFYKLSTDNFSDTKKMVLLK